MPPQITIRPDGTLALADSPVIRATGVPGGTSPMYGLGGLFGICDSHPTVINAMVGPIGVEGALNWYGSDVQHPLYEALVNMQTTGYDQSGKCADCGTPTLSQCTQSAVFGRICQMTNEHAIDDIGLRAYMTQRRKTLFGSITDPSGNVLIPEGQEIKNMFTLELGAAAYFLRYRVAWMIWNGNPNANLGGALQFPGLPLIINTGQIDVRNGQLCPALDSIIVPGNFVIGAAGSPSLTSQLERMVSGVNYRVSGMNKSPMDTEQFFVVHPRHWDCVARQMTCEYGLVCNTATDRNDAWDMRELFNKIRSGMQIPVLGRWYPVVLDNVMPQTPVPVGNQTGFRGDIYFMTRNLEGMEVLWGEYQDFQKTAGSVIAWFRQMFGAANFTVSDNGRYLWAPTTQGGFCFDVRLIVKPRLLCIMRQLQARLTNVTCIPMYPYPDVTGSSDTYEITGGITGKPYPGLYGYEGAGNPGMNPGR